MENTVDSMQQTTTFQSYYILQKFKDRRKEWCDITIRRCIDLSILNWSEFKMWTWRMENDGIFF